MENKFMKKTTSTRRDIFILLMVVLLWIMVSIPTTTDEGYTRIIVSLIFSIPVIFQTKRVIEKIKAKDK